MLSNDNELQEKIDNFLRRKEAKYPQLAEYPKHERIAKDTFKPTRLTHWALGTNLHD